MQSLQCNNSSEGYKDFSVIASVLCNVRGSLLIVNDLAWGTITSCMVSIVCANGVAHLRNRFPFMCIERSFVVMHCFVYPLNCSSTVNQLRAHAVS
jgi:hypothetical protein